MKPPRQIELHGMTSHEVRDAYARQQRKRENVKDWEDEFDFQVRARHLPPITRHYLFAKRQLGRKWESDFAYPELNLLIEIEGGLWRRGGGAHSRPANIERDIEKANDAALLRFHTLRFTTTEVRNGNAIAFLIRVLTDRGWTRT